MCILLVHIVSLSKSHSVPIKYPYGAETFLRS